MTTRTSLSRTDTWKGRFYTLPDGTKLPSVTSVLSAIAKPALVNWAAKTEREMVCQAAASLYEDLPIVPQKMARAVYLATLDARIGKQKAFQKELAKASDIGSQTHSLIEWNLRKQLGQTVGPEPKIEPKSLWAFMAYEDWHKQVSFTPQFIEQTVWSTQYGYAGTMDWFGLVETVPTLGDFKTGKAIYGEALLQNAAYVQALIEMGFAKPPVQGCIVRLPKVETDPAFEVRLIPWEAQAQLFKAFIAAKALWDWQQQDNAEYERKKSLKADQTIAEQESVPF